MDSTAAAGIWEKASQHIKGILHQDIYDRWIAVIHPVEADASSLVLAVDNDFYQAWLEEHYLPIIDDAVASVTGNRMKISFTIRRPAVTAVEPAQPVQPADARPLQKDRLARRTRPAAALNDRFTFDGFVVGPCNSFAHAASLAVAQAPARAYNPLFIYGGTGLGKSHLAQAIGHYVLKNSRATVHYVSSEAFTNEYIDALQKHALVQFRKKYRSVDLLLIDDIHFLAGKKQLQEEFFHTFNTLFDAHKQVVMTSDRPASEIVDLEQRLVSRFEWGLVTEVEPPDLETRIAILRHKVARANVHVDDQVIEFIGANIKSNIRSLEGALVRVMSYASLKGGGLDRDTLEYLLRDAISKEVEQSLSLPAIQKAVALHFDIRMTDLTSKRRPQAIATPRQVAMYLCRRLTDSSLPEIGNIFGKTHATVLHACRSIEGRMSSDNSFRRTVSTIAKSLGKNL